MTNEEKLKGLSAVELADMLSSIVFRESSLTTYYCGPTSWEATYEEAKRQWLEWLKEEATK